MKSVTLGAVRDAPPRFIAAVPKSPSGKILRRLLKHAPPSSSLLFLLRFAFVFFGGLALCR